MGSVYFPRPEEIELPKWLSSEAEKIWTEAHASALKEYGDEETAAKIAMAVVNKAGLSSHKMDGLVQRFDRGTYKPELMDNGWLRADASLTRPGVFVYLNPDGTERREYRPAEEVFNPASMASLSMVPVTNRHPGKLLDAKDTRLHAVGTVGENIRRDGESVAAKLLVTDEAAVMDAQTGVARELSCAYSCREDHTPGVYQGQPYDLIQRNIRYNHVALEPHGRAGPEMRIHMDAAEGTFVASSPTPQQEHTVKIKIEGIEYEVSDQVGQAVTLMNERHDAAMKTAKSDTDKLQAKMDTAGEQIKKLTEDLTAAKDPTKMQDAIQARVQLEQQAAPILGTEVKMDGMTADEIRLAVLAKVLPETKCEGKSADYIAARFDSVVEQHKATSINESINAIREAAAPKMDAQANAAPQGRKPGWRKDAWKQSRN